MAKINFVAVNVPKALAEELKVWKMAFTAAYGKPVSYGEIIRGMLDSLEQTEPAVVEELDNLVKRHPDLEAKMAQYHSRPGQDADE